MVYQPRAPRLDSRNLSPFRCDNNVMRLASLRASLLVCLLALAGFAQQSLSVDKLVEFVRSSIQQKLPDKDVAAFLAQVKLTQKLDPRTVEDLQGQGAGPRTMAILNKLAETSSTLAAPAPKAPKPPPPTGPPPPSAAEQEAVIREVRENGLNYTKTLPDFICLQVTRRSVDQHFQPGSQGSWSPADRILEKLTFFDQREKYEPISVNDKALLGKDWESIGGSISRGEFGTSLKEIFSPETEAEFRWTRWGTLRGNLCHVYSYRIEQSRSKETISYNRQEQITAGYHGLIYVQKGSNAILRVTIEPEIPVSFPVQDIHQSIDYNYVDISGQKFLLPLVSQVVMRTGREGSKNEIDFRSYRKYSADTTITFDDSDAEPLPEDQKTDTAAPKTDVPHKKPKF